LAYFLAFNFCFFARKAAKAQRNLFANGSNHLLLGSCFLLLVSCLLLLVSCFLYLFFFCSQSREGAKKSNGQQTLASYLLSLFFFSLAKAQSRKEI
jgi:hypothetical protein